MVIHDRSSTHFLRLSKPPLIPWVLAHDVGAVGVGFDEPGEELGVVDLLGEHSDVEIGIGLRLCRSSLDHLSV